MRSWARAIIDSKNGGGVKYRELRIQLKTWRSNLARGLGVLLLVSLGWAGMLYTHQPNAYAFSMPPTTGSWYVGSYDPTNAYNIGCSHGSYAASVGTGGLVILDFGVQINSSESLDFSGAYITDSQIQSEVVAYAHGYYACSGNQPIEIAVGTSNDGGGGSGFGGAWAYEMNGIQSAINSAGYGSKVTIYGGMDFEPNWSGLSGSVSSQSNAESWSNGFNNVSGRPFYVDYGSANGCPSSGSGSCNNGWTQYGEYYVAYGSSPALAAPEIYYYVNAQQWEAINILNPMSFYAATGEYDRNSSTNTNSQAWGDLSSLTGQDVPNSTEFQSGYM